MTEIRVDLAPVLRGGDYYDTMCEMSRWLTQTCADNSWRTCEVMGDAISIEFDSEQDATMFLLRWA